MFYAEFDNGISTKNSWYRPEMSSVIEWYKEWSNSVDLSRYKVYLIGAVAEGVQTWDVDVILMSDDINPFALKEILDKGHSIGFNHSLLIDVFWTNTFVPSAIQNGLDMSNCKRIRNHKIFKKIVDGEEIVFDFSNGYECNEIIPGLYEFIGAPIASIEKTTKRLEDDIYKGIYTELKYVI